MLLIRHFLLNSKIIFLQNRQMIRRLTDKAPPDFENVVAEVAKDPKVLEAQQKYDDLTKSLNQVNHQIFEAHTNVVVTRTDKVVTSYGEVINKRTEKALTAFETRLKDQINANGSAITTMQTQIAQHTVDLSKLSTKVYKEMGLAIAIMGALVAIIDYLRNGELKELIRENTKPLSDDAKIILEIIQKAKEELKEINHAYSTQTLPKIQQTLELFDHYEQKIKSIEKIPASLILEISSDIHEKLDKLKKINERILKMNELQNLHDRSYPRLWPSWRSHYRDEMEKIRKEMSMLNNEISLDDKARTYFILSPKT